MLKPIISSDDHQLGNSDAVHTLVEFGDFECPHCAWAHPMVKRLLSEHENKINFVFRYFPLRESHPHAFKAALAAEAAGRQNKFWEMHDLLFEHQPKLHEKLFMALASTLELDEVMFLKDYNSSEAAAKVEADFESGVRSGVSGTPGFFVNGIRVVNYNATYQSLTDAVFKKNIVKS